MGYNKSTYLHQECFLLKTWGANLPTLAVELMRTTSPCLSGAFSVLFCLFHQQCSPDLNLFRFRFDFDSIISLRSYFLVPKFSNISDFVPYLAASPGRRRHLWESWSSGTARRKRNRRSQRLTGDTWNAWSRGRCVWIQACFFINFERVKCGVIFNKEYLKINLRGNTFKKESLYQQAKMDLCFLNVHVILCP